MAPLEKCMYTSRYRHTSQRFIGALHLFKTWRGSIFKLIWYELLIFVVLYSAISGGYRIIIEIEADWAKQCREVFELICIYSMRFQKLLPITFLIGFYVSHVVTRWWDQFMALPWPDMTAFKVATYITGRASYYVNLRRTVMRYINLSTVLVYRQVSVRVQKRFPTYESLVGANLLLPEELKEIRRLEKDIPHETTWLPMMWASRLVGEACNERPVDNLDMNVCVQLLNSFERIVDCNRKLLNYGWINFPLAYTQVVNITTYFYFTAALLGRQYLVPPESALDKRFNQTSISMSVEPPFDNSTPDFWVPFFTIFEFVIYMGWIRVADSLLNPFGEDHDDIDVGYVIDRNLEVSYFIVGNDNEPPLPNDCSMQGSRKPAPLWRHAMKMRLDDLGGENSGLPEGVPLVNITIGDSTDNTNGTVPQHRPISESYQAVDDEDSSESDGSSTDSSSHDLRK